MITDPNAMTDAELARWQYAHRDQLDAEAEDGEPVEIDISPQMAVTMSFRLPSAEAESIRTAAKGQGITLSEFIRDACKDALAAREPLGEMTRATGERATHLAAIVARGFREAGVQLHLPDNAAVDVEQLDDDLRRILD